MPGRRISTGQLVALKVIDLLSIQTEVEKMLLANELKALQRLKHPNFVECYDICQTSSHVYIVMEYCNQGDLTSQIKLKGSPRLTQGDSPRKKRCSTSGRS